MGRENIFDHNEGISHVTVKTEELLKKLRENRAKHAKEFEEAITGWKKARQEELEEKRATLKMFMTGLEGAIDGNNYRYLEDAKAPYLGTNQIEPECYLPEYDQVIEMMLMSTDKKQELTSQQFSRYILDEWDWSHGFSKMSQIYSTHVGG